MYSLIDQIADAAEEFDLHDAPFEVLAASGDAGQYEVIRRYRPQIKALVSRHRVGDAEREDLEQAALLGVVAAFQEYAETSATEDLYSYAHVFIVRELHEANRSASPRPVPARTHGRFWAAMRACDGDAATAREWSALQRLTGFALRDLADDGNEIAERILDARISAWESAGRDVEVEMSVPGRGLEKASFDAIYSGFRSRVSLDAPAYDDSDAGSVADTVSDPGSADAFSGVISRATVESLLSALDERSADVVRRLYGIGCASQSSQGVAEELGVGSSRVRQIHARAIKRMLAASGQGGVA